MVESFGNNLRENNDNLPKDKFNKLFQATAWKHTHVGRSALIWTAIFLSIFFSLSLPLSLLHSFVFSLTLFLL